MRVSPEAIDNALFEGLFVLALDVSGPLAEELARLGYDRRAQQPRYDRQVLVACLDAARKSLHGALSEEEGLRKRGASFVDGFRRTSSGGWRRPRCPCWDRGGSSRGFRAGSSPCAPTSRCPWKRPGRTPRG